jgi:hypothetical protein
MMMELFMKKWAKLLSAMVIFGAVSTLHAQQQGGPPGGGGGGQDNGGGPGGGGPGGGGPDGGGPPDPQEMQAMMDKRIKSALAVTDDAWATLQPMIDKVETLEHQSDNGPHMHGPPHREDQDDNGGPDDDHPQSPVEAAISNLKKVLSDKTSTDDKIEAATKAVEDAEKKTADDLEAARKELRAAVNTRQMAVLVALGVLN